LRETRGWSYGAFGSVNLFERRSPYIILAPVQADRTGDSIAAVLAQVNAFLSNDGVRPAELNRNILGNTRQLSGQFETSPAVLNALRTNALYRRPDNYWETVAARYRGMTVQALDDTARRYLDRSNFVWVVVGDASVVRPQLERLGLPIEVVSPRNRRRFQVAPQ
jgi:predicted Zn-dependent peptidase